MGFAGVGFALCESRGVWEQQCVGVVVCELRCVGVVVFGGRGVRESNLDHNLI